MAGGNQIPRTILLIEDDSILNATLRYNLAKEGYTLLVSRDGAEGMALARKRNPDLIILDIPEGMEVCHLLHHEMKIPIILLTDRTEEPDRVKGLDAGADDYITKPFSVRELLARVRASLRRKEMNEVSLKNSRITLHIGCLEINPERHQVMLGGVPLSLTPREYSLLLFLARNRGNVYGREQLIDNVWGYDYDSDTRTVDAHIRNLREKIEEDPANPSLLLTVRGVGYKIKE
jgi:DNA-binding response OmpR family regulator